jgi:hypothetical protein
MEEELTQKDLKLLYFLYIEQGYTGGKNKLGKVLGSGKRVYDRISKLERQGLIIQTDNRIEVTERGKDHLDPFIFTRKIVATFLPVVGGIQIFLGMLGIFLPSFFTPVSLITGGIVLAIIIPYLFTEHERSVEKQFFGLDTERDTQDERKVTQ